MRRFAILEHDHPFLHWDFLLESGELLETWRLHLPEGAPEAKVRELLCQETTLSAERLPPHRMIYLEYEGEVSGGRGRVQRLEQGGFIPLQELENHWELRLEGSEVSGFVSLDQNSEGNWVFRFLPD